MEEWTLHVGGGMETQQTCLLCLEEVILSVQLGTMALSIIERPNYINMQYILRSMEALGDWTLPRGMT